MGEANGIPYIITGGGLCCTPHALTTVKSDASSTWVCERSRHCPYTEAEQERQWIDHDLLKAQYNTVQQRSKKPLSWIEPSVTVNEAALAEDERGVLHLIDLKAMCRSAILAPKRSFFALKTCVALYSAGGKAGCHFMKAFLDSLEKQN
eukprot:2056082-Amphidinium_carterae.1